VDNKYPINDMLSKTRDVTNHVPLHAPQA
jgi:hypothetical protein